MVYLFVNNHELKQTNKRTNGPTDGRTNTEAAFIRKTAGGRKKQELTMVLIRLHRREVRVMAEVKGC